MKIKNFLESLIIYESGELKRPRCFDCVYFVRINEEDGECNAKPPYPLQKNHSELSDVSEMATEKPAVMIHQFCGYGVFAHPLKYKEYCENIGL